MSHALVAFVTHKMNEFEGFYCFNSSKIDNFSMSSSKPNMEHKS